MPEELQDTKNQALPSPIALSFTSDGDFGEHRLSIEERQKILNLFLQFTVGNVYTYTQEAKPVARRGDTHKQILPLSTLEELNRVKEEAQQNHYSVPSDLATENAKKLLERVYKQAPRSYEIYPGPDAEIAVEARGDQNSVLILCESSGCVVVMTYVNGDHNTTQYQNPEDISDENLCKIVQMINQV